ncbi:unnamed protein product [Brachionus calyciflorus]|uniref:Proteasome inhibitor PI31 subunit n=1 Tax=Brachionus calyciflorus TaxID=104777 RepID=A0A813TDI0_9BILA|nr:unnamed protein product [Brachionus calyciflorus]
MPSEFCHFELYYTTWYEKFTRPADPLVLFIHWAMIQNRFKCFYDNELHEQLPLNWMNLNGCYDFRYKKYDIEYRLEVYTVNDSLFVQLRNMNNMLDSTQYIKIADFIDTENYKNNSKYKMVYKDMDKLYINIKWSIDRFRTKKIVETSKIKESEIRNEKVSDDAMEIDQVEQATTCSVSSSSTQISKKSRKETKKSLGLICDILTSNFLKNPEITENSSKLKNVSSHNELVSHIKQEKAEFDLHVESYYRRYSTSSNRSNEPSVCGSGTNLSEAPSGNARKKSSKKLRPSFKKKDDALINPETQNEIVVDVVVQETPVVQSVEEPKQTEGDLLKPKINRDDKNNLERDKINRNLLFDYNPITNYFFYNKRVDQKKIDQKILEEDEFVQRAYKKFNINMNLYCEIKLIDCFRTDMFKGLKAPIKLTDDVKKKLNLNSMEVDNEYEDDVYDDDDDQYEFIDDGIDTKKKSSNTQKKSKKKQLQINKRRNNHSNGNKAKTLIVNIKKKNEARSKNSVKSSESSPLLIDSEYDDVDKSKVKENVVSDVMANFLKNGKRKRSISAESDELPNLDMAMDVTNSVKENLVDEKNECNEMEKNYMSPDARKKNNSNTEPIFKKLLFSTVTKSSISIERLDKTNESNLSINLFGKENEDADMERPSKRTKKDSNEELVDLNTSIEIKVNVNSVKEDDSVKSPKTTKTPCKTLNQTQNKTPGKTPSRLVTVFSSATPTSKFKEISNCTIDYTIDTLTPKKFYTSTQIGQAKDLSTSQIINDTLNENNPSQKLLTEEGSEENTIVRE